jgi:LuxR family maltose regulon positive regulatory protein
VLERGRLSSQRVEFVDKSVVAIKAAAGSGKTSLLAQWRKEALQTGAVVAWLTLDNLDEDSRFIMGLIHAMRASSGRPTFGKSWLWDTRSEVSPLAAMTGWLAEVADLAVETLLILDDVHAMPEATLHSSLVYLLLNAPANLKIVLSSRKTIALPITELSSRGRCATILDQDMRFDLNETILLLRTRFSQRISMDSCVRLYELTEGWPLGIQLAISSIERSPDLQEAIAGFSVKFSDMQRYFVESLVNRLPEAMAQFLVSVAFVDDLSPALCEAITGKEKSGELLVKLCELTPIFIEGVESDWVRIHPLAREFLRERFEQLPEKQKRDNHARAGHWLADNELYEAAGRHMLKAGLDKLAYDLAERCLHAVATTGNVALVTFWIEQIPAAEIMRRTSLRLVVGWILAQSERHAEAAKMVESIINDPVADAGDQCESAEICATAAFFADDIDSMRPYVEAWYEALPPQSMLHKLVGANLLAILTVYRGAPEQARYALTSLHNINTVGGYTLGWRDWLIGLSYIWEGQVDFGVKKLRSSLARAEQNSGRRSPIAVMLAVALATALWECNQPDEAATLIANRLDILERRTPPDAIVMGYVTAARVELAGNREQNALELLDYLFSLGEARNLPRLCVASLSERIRMHALRRRSDMCAAAARKLDVFISGLGDHTWGLLTPVIEVQIGLARAYANIARNEWKLALTQLNATAPIAEELHRGCETLRIRLLKALAMKRCGEDGTALLRDTLSMADLWGLSRMSADTHPDLVEWAGQLNEGQIGDDHSRERPIQTLKPAVLSEKPRQATVTHIAKKSLLSPKELEVIKLLASNLSNKQIGMAMGVSDETIKWHLKNLFGKLNAGSRKHLVARARIMGLIDH